MEAQVKAYLKAGHSFNKVYDLMKGSGQFLMGKSTFYEIYGHLRPPCGKEIVRRNLELIDKKIKAGRTYISVWEDLKATTGFKGTYSSFMKALSEL